jgi:hypothetical protein
MQFDATMLNIGLTREHFFDDLLIESVENVERLVHKPERFQLNPIIRPDRPWEQIFETTVSAVAVLFDPKEDIFRCWYMNETVIPRKFGVEKEDALEFVTDPNAISMSICYAESKDGINWKKPNLGILKYNGSETNIILGGQGYSSVFNMTPVIDPFEPDPAKRFKTLYTIWPHDMSGVQDIAAYSADGIHWTSFKEKPSFGKHGNRLDDVHKILVDPLGRLFIMTSRHNDMYAGSLNLRNPRVGGFTPPYYPYDFYRRNKRRIFQSESADFLHWTEPHIAIIPEDGFDGIDHTFYGMPQFDIGDVRVGFLNVFQYVENRLSVQLTYSHNGHDWIRFNRGATWLDHGAAEEWDSVMVAIENPPIPVGDEWFIYYGGASCHHDWWLAGESENLDVQEARDISMARYAIGLLRMRQEGIVGMHANAVRQGILITRPLISEGRRLAINAECGSRGSIQVEVADALDQVLPGFSRGECDTFTGNSINHIVTWRGQDLIPVQTKHSRYPSPENERFRKLRFFLRDAEIFAMQFIN